MKILMIDDDDELRILVGIHIRSAGYEMFQAVNGEDGKEKLKTLQPDLIILDMMMPVLDGIGFLRWLRQDAKLDIPVLAFTSMNKSETNIEIKGATGIVFKPVELDELVGEIRKILKE
ncbi:response regulator [Candidatus Halobeggiatoa sp. HSG11]|nr:response regulator [Candidatus Halobeggiatoa sp. HSG11]